MADIRIELGYYDRQPVMCLAPKVERTSNKGQRFLIGINQLHKYSEDHNATFEQHMARVSRAILERFDLLPVNSKKMADIASLIQSRIEDLLKVPPLPSTKKAVASVIVKHDGNPFEHIISEETNAGYIKYASG